LRTERSGSCKPSPGEPGGSVDALETAGWNTKLASLVAARVWTPTAMSALEESGGRLRQALSLSGANPPMAGPGNGHRHGHGDGGESAKARSRPLGSARRLGVAAALVDAPWSLGTVAVDEGLIAAVGLTGAVRDRRARFVDLQVNGYAG